MAVVRSPLAEDDAVAGDDIGGHGAERDGEVVEILDLRHGQREPAQDLRELLSLDQATRQAELPALETERKLHEEVLIFELATEIEIELRGGLSRKASCQSTEVMTRSTSAAESPEAYKPPTTAPMLVPAMTSTGTWFSSSTLSTPM